MNNFIGNFIGFDGRLNRQAWWLSVIALIVVAVVLSWIIGMIMGTGGMLTLEQAMDPAYLQKAAWQGLIVSVITAYPYLAISVKRRHDRNNNGYDAIGLIVVGILYNLLQALGIITMGNTVGMIVGLVFAVYAIYMLVQLGFLKGTAGPNNYGPDPLGG
jgi:uncharacterized membrane protein YhaH (DUF805 family)